MSKWPVSIKCHQIRISWGRQRQFVGAYAGPRATAHADMDWGSYGGIAGGTPGRPATPWPETRRSLHGPIRWLVTSIGGGAVLPPAPTPHVPAVLELRPAPTAPLVPGGHSSSQRPISPALVIAPTPHPEDGAWLLTVLATQSAGMKRPRAPLRPWVRFGLPALLGIPNPFAIGSRLPSGIPAAGPPPPTGGVRHGGPSRA